MELREPGGDRDRFDGTWLERGMGCDGRRGSTKVSGEAAMPEDDRKNQREQSRPGREVHKTSGKSAGRKAQDDLEIGCPTWIRTMTNSSKGSCATITPSDKPRVKILMRGVCARILARVDFQPPTAVYLRMPRLKTHRAKRKKNTVQKA